MLRRKEVLDLIEGGESSEVEFKLRFSSDEKIAKELIAFANTKGGWIFFGVDDRGKICGVESEKGEAELVRISAEQFCEPPVPYEIQFMNIEEKELVIVHVPESSAKPHRLQDYLEEIDIRNAAVFIRVEAASLPASKEMIRIMRAASQKKELQKYSIGKVEQAVFSLLEQEGKIDVIGLSKAANISGRRASRTLVNMVRAELLFIHTKDNGEEFFTVAF